MDLLTSQDCWPGYVLRAQGSPWGPPSASQPTCGRLDYILSFQDIQSNTVIKDNENKAVRSNFRMLFLDNSLLNIAYTI